MVTPEQMKEYYEYEGKEKEAIEESKKTGKTVQEVLASKAAAEEKAEQKQQQEETKQATIAEQKSK